MATPQTRPPEPLPHDFATLLSDFAKACKAATRVVSMYPPSHPTIQAALSRITSAGKQLLAGGPVAIAVMPDALMVGGRSFAKPDPAAGELAALLHLQLIGELTLLDPLNNDQWHAFLTLLARSPDDARAAGGLAHSWSELGNKSITLKEIDYSEVLRERAGSGAAASWDRILQTLKDVKDESGEVEEPTGMEAMLELAKDPDQLAQFAERLQEHGEASGDDSVQQRHSLLELMHGLANYAAEQQPEELDAVLNRMAGAAVQLSPDMLLTLITDPPPLQPPGTIKPGMDLGGELQARLTDEMLTKFLVENVMKERGASGRLAAAFQTLVPDPSRQQDILAAATAQAQELFAQDPQFESVWNSSTELLTTYSDSEYVSDEYDRELTSARTQATDIEKIGDDPPSRIRSWVSTLNDEEIRALDQRLLLDLLTIETRTEAWAGVLDLTIVGIEQLVLIGDLPLASQLVDAVVGATKSANAQFAAYAAAGVDRLVEGSLVRHLSLFLRQATDDEVGAAAQICQTIGPVLVEPLADALAAEDNARTVRRLRDILIGFGTAARRYADELRTSPNPAVRRAAIDLLRALGGEAALPDLRGMLDDSEPQVQREALRAIVQIGSNEAYEMLEKALKGGKPHTREAILQALGSFRDERAAPLFVHLLTNTGYKGPLEQEYLSSIDSLGRVANDEQSVSTLKDILYRGEWYSPGRTSRLRSAAARALRAIGLPSAERVLTEAAEGGSGGVKRAARTALAEPAPTRQAQRRNA